MESLPGTALWALLGVSALALLATSSLRWVPPGHLLVATRRGLVSRVAGPGVFVRVPVVDRVVVLPAGPEELPLVTHGTTRDGTRVRLLATAHVRVLAPAPDETYVDPCGPAARAAERVLAAAVRRHDVDELPDALQRSWDEVVAAAEHACRPLGVEVHDLDLEELDALLARLPARGPE